MKEQTPLPSSTAMASASSFEVSCLTLGEESAPSSDLVFSFLLFFVFFTFTSATSSHPLSSTASFSSSLDFSFFDFLDFFFLCFSSTHSPSDAQTAWPSDGVSIESIYSSLVSATLSFFFFFLLFFNSAPEFSSSSVVPSAVF